MARFSMPLTLSALFAVAFAARTARAAFDGDLVPRLAGSQIVTDGLSDEDGSFASNIRVFQYTLGDVSPGYTEDPGFQPQTTSGLPASSYIGFNVVTGLEYWNGTGTPTFTAAPSAGSFELYFGALHTFITPSSGQQDGFVIQQLTAEGAGHRHLNAQLLGAPDTAGSYIDSLGNSYDAPPDGIYAFAIQVTDSAAVTTDPAALTSAPVWLVYNQGLGDDQLTTGGDAIAATLAPEPATLGLGVVSISLLLARRSRTRVH